MSMRQCPYCGKSIAEAYKECPQCRVALPEIQVTRQRDTQAGTQIRRGLLYVLLAAVINYFAGGYSAMQLPLPIVPIVTNCLAPMLFLGGVGLAIHGFYIQRKSWTHTVRYR
jgi:hypothetical protein